MKTMTWQEIEKDWGGLQKKHRMEIAQAVARYCIGHKMADVANQLGFTAPWVCTQLDYAGVGAAIEDLTGVNSPKLAGAKGQQRATDNGVSRVVADFAPAVTVQYKGTAKDSIAKIEGDDAEAFETYIAFYEGQGHKPPAAARLAKAEWAAKAAVEAGVIKESVNKRKEKVNQILFPNEKETSFDLDLKHHMARVKSAARFLDEAKMNCLRRKSTCEKVAEASEAWSEQMDRVLSLHPTFNGG